MNRILFLSSLKYKKNPFELRLDPELVLSAEPDPRKENLFPHPWLNVSNIHTNYLCILYVTPPSPTEE